MLTVITVAALHAGISGTARGAELDTIRAYDPSSARRYITKSRYVRQLQRFSVRNGASVHAIRFMVAGKPRKHAGTVRLYGDEGGLIVPRLRTVLADGNTFEKRQSGREWISVEFERPVALRGAQFFVEIEFTDPDLRLMSDSRPRVERCMESTSLPRLDQMHVNPGDTSWTETPYGYYIEVMLESRELQPGLRVDTLFRPFDVVVHPDVQPVSCGDLGGDGFLDLATTGQLHFNDRGQFRSISCDDGGRPAYLFFWDADGDGVSELAVTRLDSANEVRVFRVLNNTLTLLHSVRLTSPVNIRGMVQADLNRDGTLDLLLSSKTANGFEFHLVTASEMTAREVVGAMSQFGENVESLVMTCIDVAHDGNIEILCRSNSSLDAFALSLDGTSKSVGVKVDAASREYVASAITATGNSKNLAITPANVRWNEIDEHEWTQSTPLISVVDSNANVPAIARQAWWSDRQGPFLQTDLDNDGFFEYVSFQSGGCGLVRVFSVNSSGYSETTTRWGLDTVYGCTDGISADFDLDGRTDLVLLRNGKPQLFRNASEGPRIHSVRLRTAGISEGALVVGNNSSFVYKAHSGRNLLIQDPQTLYISERDIEDSILVHWPEGRSERFSIPQTTTNHLLQEGTGVSADNLGKDAMTCSASFESGVVFVKGLKQGADHHVVVRSMNGTMLASSHTSESQISLQLGLAASGKYVVTVTSNEAVCSTMLTIVQ